MQSELKMFFSGLIYKIANIERYNPYKQMVFGIFNNFYESKGALRPKLSDLGTAGIDFLPAKTWSICHILYA